VPYLHDLGVDIVWLSPIYKSPWADCGYDISDYRDIDPRFGTLQDWEELKDAVHAKGMKLVMDLVVNHTSDKVSPLKAYASTAVRLTDSMLGLKNRGPRWTTPRETGTSGSRRSTTTKGSASRPTTGTLFLEGTFSCDKHRAMLRFSGPSWTYDEKTDQWYCHTFLSEQPDLNWENPEVREAIWDLMHWWMQKGSDGFRMDVVSVMGVAHGAP